MEVVNVEAAAAAVVVEAIVVATVDIMAAEIVAAVTVADRLLRIIVVDLGEIIDHAVALIHLVSIEKQCISQVLSL